VKNRSAESTTAFRNSINIGANSSKVARIEYFRNRLIDANYNRLIESVSK